MGREVPVGFQNSDRIRERSAGSFKLELSCCQLASDGGEGSGLSAYFGLWPGTRAGEFPSARVLATSFLTSFGADNRGRPWTTEPLPTDGFSTYFKGGFWRLECGAHAMLRITGSWPLRIAARLDAIADQLHLAGATGEGEAEMVVHACRRGADAAGLKPSDPQEGPTASPHFYQLKHTRRPMWTEPDLAWQELHEAEEALLRVATNDYVMAQATNILGRLHEGGSDAADPREAQWTTVANRVQSLPAAAPISLADREQLRQALAYVNDASDRAQRGTKSYRSTLVSIALLASVALLVVAIASVLDPKDFPTCGPSAPGSQTTVCFNGGVEARPWDMAMLLVAGGLGGLMSALAFLGKINTLENPYRLQLIQLAIKFPVGSITALAGIAALQSSALTSLKPVPGTQLLLYAIVFGFGQQAITTWLDNKASSVLSNRNGKQSATAGSKKGGPGAQS